MTPKEKAIVLVHKLKNEFGLTDWESKQCAKMSAKEIIEVLETLRKPEVVAFDAEEPRKYKYDGEYPEFLHGYDMKYYFQEVLAEIENI